MTTLKMQFNDARPLPTFLELPLIPVSEESVSCGHQSQYLLVFVIQKVETVDPRGTETVIDNSADTPNPHLI